MSMHFSNAHLQVPRGFATILEGLAREVLRDQPEDIPKYAAQYFKTLLIKRQESGVDPVEWAARLEDRYYNNHAFISPATAPETPTETEMAIEKSDEDQSTNAAGISDLSTLQPNATAEIELLESTGEEEEKQDVTERQISPEEAPSEGESVSGLPDADQQPDEVSDKEEERDSTTTTFDQVGGAANENDSHSVPDQDKPLSASGPTDLLSCRGYSDVNVCSQQLGTAGDEAFVDKPTADAAEEEKTEVKEPAEEFLLLQTDEFATKPLEPEMTIEGTTDDTHVADDKSKLEPEETLLPPSTASKTRGDDQQEAEDQAETTKEKREAQISSEGENECSEGGFDSNVIPKEDSLVEISFDDVPEAQQIKEFGEKQPEEEVSVEASQTNIMEMQTEERSKEVAAAASDQNISVTYDGDEYKMVGVGKEVNSEGGEMGSRHEAPLMTESVEANDSNVSDEAEKVGEGVESISSSPQPHSQAEIGEPESGNAQAKQDIGKTGGDDGDLQQEDPSNPDLKEAETLDSVRQDKEDMLKASNEQNNQEIGGDDDDDLQQDNVSNPDFKEVETFDSLRRDKEDMQKVSNEEKNQKICDDDDLQQENPYNPDFKEVETLDSLRQDKENMLKAKNEEDDQEIGDDGDLHQKNPNNPDFKEVETLDSARQDKEDMKKTKNEEDDQEIGDDDDGLQQENRSNPDLKEVETFDSPRQDKEDMQKTKNEEDDQEIGDGGDLQQKNPNNPDFKEVETLDSVRQDKEDMKKAKNEEDDQEIGGDDDGLQQDNVSNPDLKEVETLDSLRRDKEDMLNSSNEENNQEIGDDDDDLQQENPNNPEVETLDSARQDKEDMQKAKNEEDDQEIGDDGDGLQEDNVSNPDLKEVETLDSVRQDQEDMQKTKNEENDQEFSGDDEDNNENQIPQVTQSKLPTATMEAKSETLEACAQSLPEQSEKCQGALEETQPEDTGNEKEATSKEGTSEADDPREEGKNDSEIQERTDATSGADSISAGRSADQPAAGVQEAERPLMSERDSTTQPDGSGGDEQEECSRPQEEEDIMDIPLDDPEANRAAAKIQAGFRGHMTRKKMKPEDKTEGEEVSSTGDVLNGSQGAAETGGSGAVERDDTSVPEQ